MAKTYQLTAKRVRKIIKEHEGNVVFGAQIVARTTEGGKIEARLLDINNIWSGWMLTDAAEIAEECKSRGFDSSMIVRQ